MTSQTSDQGTFTFQFGKRFQNVLNRFTSPIPTGPGVPVLRQPYALLDLSVQFCRATCNLPPPREINIRLRHLWQARNGAQLGTRGVAR